MSELRDFHSGRSYAEQLDAADPLRAFRARFAIPRTEDNEEVVYLCGNSLGLMPQNAARYVNDELDTWKNAAVDGHFDGKRPWYGYHEQFTNLAAHVVGADPGEVVIMNSLTVNLHLMMVSFYRPTTTRHRILIEENAFPSDRYAVESQARFHGFDPDEAIVVMRPRDGEDLLRTEDIESLLASDDGQKVALVLMGGVNFYTGQAYDLERIARAARKAGAVCGFDLAHAAGNMPVQLHDWDVDFACFCTYKYLNAGPGSVAGCFVNARYDDDKTLPRFAGWWGNDPQTRFKMEDRFTPQRGAAGWQLSNAPIFSMAALLASLEIFEEAGMVRLREKAMLQTAYLLRLVDEIGHGAFRVITPREPQARGCQISLRAPGDAKRLRDLLQARGVVSDFRPPDVVRVAPVPLYNSFVDVWRFAQVLKESVGA
jgi:kynureninase